MTDDPVTDDPVTDDPAAGEVSVQSVAQLRAILGEPLPRVVTKDRDRLHALDIEWLAAAPFCLVATAAADGSCDVSPKGDPAGAVAVVLDDRTICLPERPGNRRGDGFVNILSNPHVGLIFIIPGRGDTLRINGRARLVSEAPWFDRLVVAGHRPTLATVVDIEQVFHHCSKAFLRSALWQPATWDPEAVAGRPMIAKALERPDDSAEELERYYGPSYGANLYG